MGKSRNLMLNRGKLVVLSIFALAIAMAAFALWWNWGQGRRSLEFWGKEGGLAIRDAKKVEIRKLKTTNPDNTEIENFQQSSKEQNLQGKTKVDENGSIYRAETFTTDIQTQETLETKDVTGVSGLVHARHAFLEDASFQWNEPAAYFGTDWQYAIRFQDEARETTVLLDLKKGVVGSQEKYQALRLSPKTVSGWKLFVRRYFPDDAALAPVSSE